MDLEDVLKQLTGDEDPEREVQVVVDLNVREPREELLTRLADAGFSLRSTIGNKLLGAVAAGKVDALKADDDVRHVEIESRLSRHAE